MASESGAPSFGRRTFLKQAGFAAGGMAATPLLGLSKLFPESAIGPVRNVLMIVVDDMNDWTPLLSDASVHTPNLERLAKQSAVFTRAYCSAPACCPSRTSFLTGMRPSTSGVYFNNQSYRDAHTSVRDAVNLPQHFKANGYLTAGYGKIFHGRYQDRDVHAWSEGHYVGQESEAHLYEAAESSTDLDGVWPYSWGMLPDDWDRDDWDLMPQDSRNANRIADFIRSADKTPFFAAFGIYKPHSRWYAPKRYFDLYPIEEIRIPKGVREDDLEDVPPCARWLAQRNVTPDTHRTLIKRGLWKHAIQAYMACVTYADRQIGRVLDALDASPHRDNTVVVLCSDHGYHLGEKEHWNKFTLWERSSRVPFMISVPGVTTEAPSKCAAPVSLLDIFPTLNNLCGLPNVGSHRLEGHDLSPLLPLGSKFHRPPVLSTYGRGNHTVRSEQWRYIRYVDGTEELYDHRSDPHEWHNLAAEVRLADVKNRLRHFLPSNEAKSIRADPTRPVEWLDEALFQPIGI
jgi:arylsulfatase A-like enzyme